MESSLFLAVDQFISDTFSRDDTALRAVTSSLARAGIGDISVSSSQGKVLHVLARACRASRILEVGTLGGYSTIWLARALPRGGRLVTIESEPAHAELARANLARARVSRIVDLRVGKALEILPRLQREKARFDLVFIDADKESNEQYFRWALKLVHRGSLILVDNVVRQGAILEAGHSDGRVAATRKFLQLLSRTKAVSAGVLQTVGAKGHDGLAFAVVL